MTQQPAGGMSAGTHLVDFPRVGGRVRNRPDATSCKLADRGLHRLVSDAERYPSRAAPDRTFGAT